MTLQQSLLFQKLWLTASFNHNSFHERSSIAPNVVNQRLYTSSLNNEQLILEW